MQARRQESSLQQRAPYAIVHAHAIILKGAIDMARRSAR